MCTSVQQRKHKLKENYPMNIPTKFGSNWSSVKHLFSFTVIMQMSILVYDLGLVTFYCV